MMPESEKLTWTTSGAFGMELLGIDENGDHVATVVCKSDGTWTFVFTGYAGRGTIQVGNGCDYNPLHMVEVLRTHFITPDENDYMQFKPKVKKADIDPNWVNWDEGWTEEWS